MKKKIFPLFFVLLFILFTFLGCMRNPVDSNVTSDEKSENANTPSIEETPSTEEIPSTEETPTESTNDLQGMEPVEKLPMTQFPKIQVTPGWMEESLKNYYQPSITALPERGSWLTSFFGERFGCCTGGNGYAYTIWHVQNIDALDYVLLLDGEHVCTVSRMRDNTYGITKYVYCVFKKEMYKSALDGSIQESWDNVGEVYFVSQRLSSNDFSQLAVGDSITELIAIEPAIRRTKSALGESICDDSFPLLLEDGLLYVRTSDTSVTEENRITHLEFHPYGESVTIHGIEAFMAVSPVRPPLPEADAEAE